MTSQNTISKPEKVVQAIKPKTPTKVKSRDKPPEAQPIASKQAEDENLPHTHEPQLSNNPAPSPEPSSTSPQPDTITFIPHSELRPFKGHPFQIRNDTDMQALIASVKERGVSQPALVRPREDGGYEIIAGHRRQFASKEAGYDGVPCVIRNMSDEEAVLAMTESNFNQRISILASERAKALKMQLEAIKRQGARNGVSSTDLGRRSNEIIAERNGMSVKNVQRYIALNNLIPELIKYVDDKKMKFTAAVDLSYVRPRNQRYIAMAIEAQQESPSVSQAQKLRELDQPITDSHDVNILSGIIRCADCGSAMAFNRKVRKNGAEKLIYRCSRHANSGAGTCTTHTIDAEILETVLLHEIRRHAKEAIKDERGLLRRLFEYSGESVKNEVASLERRLRDTESRISFIESAGKQLFEERVSGNVPDAMFKKMLGDYELETQDLITKAQDLRNQIQESRNSQADVHRWMKLIKECAGVEKLDRAQAYRLIDQVSVHEKADECGIRTHTVKIKYNFVGDISLN